MTFNYRAPDGEKFIQKQNGLRHVAELENCRISDAEQILEEIEESEKEDEEMLDVFEFRIVEHWSAERTVKVKANNKDHAEKMAEEKLVLSEPELTHKMHTEIDKLSKVEEVPRSELESGEYWEDDSE